MRNLDTINNKLLFNQIHNRLKREFGQLPDGGVVAGQAVSSAVIEMLGIGKAFITIWIFFVLTENIQIFTLKKMKCIDLILSRRSIRMI